MGTTSILGSVHQGEHITRLTFVSNALLKNVNLVIWAQHTSFELELTTCSLTEAPYSRDGFLIFGLIGRVQGAAPLVSPAGFSRGSPSSSQKPSRQV